MSVTAAPPDSKRESGPAKAAKGKAAKQKEPARRSAGRLTLAHLEPAIAAVVLVLAVLPLNSFYGSLGWLPAIGGAAVLGVAVGVLAAARRWGQLVTALVSVVLLTGYVLYVCYPTTTNYGLPGMATLRALGTGASDGWARMLTVALPADVTGDLVTTPVVVAFAAGLATALLALRTRLVTVLALPPLLLFVAALLATASRPASWSLVTVSVLPALLLLLLLRANRITAADREGITERDADAVGVDLAARRWHSTLGRVAFGLPVVAIAAAAGVVGAGLLPIADGSDRADPRDLRQQEFRLAAGLTPLVQVKPQLEAPARELFTVQVTQRGGKVPVDRVRVATLDSFDGALWTQSRDFLITGSTLPEGPALDRPLVSVELDVQISRMPQPFLPVVGRPVHVDGVDFAFDPANGTLVSTRPAVADYHYRVVGEVRPDAGIGRAPAATNLPEYTRLPNRPDWVRDLAAKVTEDWQTPWTQLLAIQDYLRTKGYLVDEARPGHSYGAVYRTLLGSPEEQAGYAEQFASAFAILAREKGYAARVAVGYRLREDKRAGERYRVESTDVHAWPEVFLSGYGWVAFEPTNTQNEATSKPPRDADAPILPDRGKEQPSQPEQDNTAVAGTETGAGGLDTTRAALLIVALLALLPVLVIVLIVLAKMQRRRRRRRKGSPAERVVAAWREVADRLRERGLPVQPADTPVEVAKAAWTGPTAPAAPRLGELAPLVTAAVCAPVEPSVAEVDRAWALEAESRKTLDAATPLIARIRALVDPRPLLPRRRRRIRIGQLPDPPPAGPDGGAGGDRTGAGQASARG